MTQPDGLVESKNLSIRFEAIMLEEKTYDTGTVILNYAEGPPSGPPLLLLPAMTRSWKSFLPIIPALIPDWYVFVLDYRGHGKSGRVPNSYRAKDHYEDLKAFVFHFFSEPLVLLGHSMGGGMSFGFAEEYPEKLRGLIIGDGSLDHDLHIMKMTTKGMQRFYSSTQKLAGMPLDELVALFEERGTPVEHAEELSQLDPGVLEYHARGRLQEYFEGISSPDLNWITCPILMIQGNPSKGSLLSDGEVEQALSQHSHISHVRIEHAGHDLGFWRGELAPFTQAVIDFLETVK
jgi:pimeloyl-ACP methyl ester carboxylesterase